MDRTKNIDEVKAEIADHVPIDAETERIVRERLLTLDEGVKTASPWAEVELAFFADSKPAAQLKPVVLTRIAEVDIARAINWYEERKEGLGAEFLVRVRDCIEKIGQTRKVMPHRVHSRRAQYRQSH